MRETTKQMKIQTRRRRKKKSQRDIHIRRTETATHSLSQVQTLSNRREVDMKEWKTQDRESQPQGWGVDTNIEQGHTQAASGRSRGRGRAEAEAH